MFRSNGSMRQSSGLPYILRVLRVPGCSCLLHRQMYLGTLNSYISPINPKRRESIIVSTGLMDSKLRQEKQKFKDLGLVEAWLGFRA